MTSVSGEVITRRQFGSRLSGMALVVFCAKFGRAQNLSGQHTVGSFQAKLFSEFQNSALYAISPDGRHVCLYSFYHFENFLKPWSYDGGNTKKTEDVLRIIELDTGKTIYATQLRTMVVSASFFGEGQSLYAETMPMVEVEGGGATTVQAAFIEIKARKLDERLSKFTGVSVSYSALSGRVLLGEESSFRNARMSALTLSRLPDYKEIARVPVAPTGQREPNGNNLLVPSFSADRKTVVYSIDHWIVCRRTEDLSIIWTRQVEPEYYGAYLSTIAPDGSRAAAAVVDNDVIRNQKRFYVGIYNGKDGSIITKLPMNGAHGVALSADGRLIAISQRVELPTGQIEPTVSIYEIDSGDQVGKVTHPPVRAGRMEFNKGVVGSQFTSNGKYLITSGDNSTRVWNLG